jgi:predicted methyltransferase
MIQIVAHITFADNGKHAAAVNFQTAVYAEVPVGGMPGIEEHGAAQISGAEAVQQSRRTTCVIHIHEAIAYFRYRNVQRRLRGRRRGQQQGKQHD